MTTRRRPSPTSSGPTTGWEASSTRVTSGRAGRWGASSSTVVAGCDGLAIWGFGFGCEVVGFTLGDSTGPPPRFRDSSPGSARQEPRPRQTGPDAIHDSIGQPLDGVRVLGLAF